MVETYDRQKMLETLLDSGISTILLELENGEKSSTQIQEKLGLSEIQIQEKLAYLTKYDFVRIKNKGNEIFFSVNKEKLDSFMESDGNFSGIEDGLTELDSFLN